MRELRVEDALLYLDQVKVEFGDRPHIYNEFLDIMKTFKTQQIDTPGVIRRVSNLFQGNRRLVLGFNTFLPEGYKIELPLDGNGPPVAVFRAPGSNVTHVLSASGPTPGLPLQAGPAVASRAGMPPHGQAMPAAGPGMPPQRGPGMPSQHSLDATQGEAGYGVKPSALDPLEQVAKEADARKRVQQQQPNAAGNFPGAGGPPRAMGGGQPGARPQAGRPQQPMEAGAAGQRMAPPHGAPPAAPAGAAGRNFEVHQPAPLEFDHAINYVTTIKKRFSTEPETYKRFLEILHTYQKEQRGIKEVLDEVSTLFADHPDLLKEFTYFLPDAVQGQAKAQLDQVAKESEARKRAQAKQAIMHTAQDMQREAQGIPRAQAADARSGYDRGAVQVPFGATQGRSLERERDIVRGAHFGVISFAPVLPPKRNELNATETAQKKGRPTAIPELPLLASTAETSFFQRSKEHLNRKELAADKAPGSRRHTPYTEFIKCLHLFGSGILNKDELVLLLRGLFMQGHAPKSGINAGGGVTNPSVANDAGELLRELEEVLVGRGPYADQETTLKDKSKYGGLRSQDFDYSNCEVVTPSYRPHPTDYPQSLFISNPGQSEMDASVLNQSVVCVGNEKGSRKRLTRSLDEYNGVRARHNIYEDAVFSIEDERFEVDMAIERNSQAMRQIEPYAQEVQDLREQEEKDGQPIGRLQYQLNRYAMNSVHINAIGRLYGDQGDEVLQHLARNPLIVLPIVFQRLKQKDAEWRKLKAELTEKWKVAFETNYEGSRDLLCYKYRRELERIFTPTLLREECKRARLYCKHPEKIRDHPATADFTPKFALSSQDKDAILYQPFLEVSSKVDASHKDALTFVMQQLKSGSKVSAFDRERIGRIWAEFMVPWFGYPSHWVMDEVRASYSGKLTPAVVKMAPGQTVSTIFGVGTIVSCTNMDEGIAKYRIKFPFGVAHLSPSAILHAVPSKDTPYVRHDGTMVREDAVVENGGLSSAKLDPKYKLLFATESSYLFLRLYSLLCSILATTREHCESFDARDDPAKSYHNPAVKEDKEDEEEAQTLEYSGVLSCLQKVLANKMEFKDFEALGRKISKEKVHQMAALPKLIERCADALVKVAKEDVLLHLFDFCQNEGNDPVAVRTHCLAFAPDASFRIQYDAAGEAMSFSYVPKGEELLTAPRDDIEDADEEMNGVADPMDEDEDPIDEFDSDGGPSAKRSKLK